MPEFSDPAWWPKPPPRPPVATPLPRLLVGVLFPLAVVAGVVTLLLTQSGRSSSAPARSLAAYESCVRSHGGGSRGRRPTEASAACQAFLPPGSAVGSFGAPGAAGGAQARFDSCVRTATANLPHGGFGSRGGFGRGGGPSPIFRAAVAVCQRLVAGSGSDAASTPAPATATTPPAA